MHTSGEDKRLEHLVHEVLRTQPLRTAPAALHVRVMEEIRHRARLRWWQRSFSHWPLAAKGLFLPACALCAVVLLELLAWLFTPAAPLAPAWALLSSLAHALLTAGRPLSIAGAVPQLSQAMPPQWLQATLAAGAALYVLLFALCATAYRFLYLDRQITHEPS